MANGWSWNGTRFRMRWKIDVLFNEAKPRGGGGGGGGGGGEAELNRTSIFHRMRNIVPLHRSKPLAICVVQHLEYQRNWRRLIRISYLGWVKFYFSPSWLNIASAHDQSVTRISFTKQFLCARRLRKSTLIRSAVIVTSCHCWEWYETARPLNGTQLLNGWAPIGAYTTSFLGVVQYNFTLFHFHN